MDSRLRWCGCPFTVFCHHYFTNTNNTKERAMTASRKPLIDLVLADPTLDSREKTFVLLDLVKAELISHEYASELILGTEESNG